MVAAEKPPMAKETAMRCAIEMAGIKNQPQAAGKPKSWSPFEVISALEVLALENLRLQALPPPNETLEHRIEELERDNKRLEELLKSDEAAYNWAVYAFFEIRNTAKDAKAIAEAAVTTVPAVRHALDKIIDMTMDIYKPAKHVVPAAAPAIAPEAA